MNIIAMQIGSGALSPWREAHYSPPASAEVKETWIYTCTPQYSFMA
jgi:hypothetical protein